MLDLINDRKYMNEYARLNYDYDRENPVTKKEGFLRLISHMYQ